MQADIENSTNSAVLKIPLYHSKRIWIETVFVVILVVIFVWRKNLENKYLENKLLQKSMKHNF